MSKATALALAQNSLAESLLRLMEEQEPPDRRKNNSGNGVQNSPGDAKDTRGGQIQVRYTCVTGETTITHTTKEPRIAAPRHTCPLCRLITIEGRGLRVKPICYWERLE